MQIIRDSVLFGLITCSMYFDLKTRKIPNKLTIPCFILGLFLHGYEAGLYGAVQGALGAGTGILIFLIPFALGGMGAGDVKMLGAIGALMGVQFVFNTALLAAVSGGIIALVYLIYKLGFIGTIRKLFTPLLYKLFHFVYVRSGSKWFGTKSNQLRDSSSNRTDFFIPYAVPISVGAMLTYFQILM